MAHHGAKCNENLDSAAKRLAATVHGTASLKASSAGASHPFPELMNDNKT
jgi:hypothetical protein